MERKIDGSKIKMIVIDKEIADGLESKISAFPVYYKGVFIKNIIKGLVSDDLTYPNIEENTIYRRSETHDS